MLLLRWHVLIKVIFKRLKNLLMLLQNPGLIVFSFKYSKLKPALIPFSTSL